MERYKPLFKEGIYNHDKDMIVDQHNINLQHEYDNLNHILFNNELKKILLKWSSLKNVGAKVVSIGIKNKPETWEIQRMEVSTFMEVTYENFINILAHEMVHVYLIQNHKAEFGGGHGLFFQQEKDKINKMGHGIHVTNTEDITTGRISSNIKGKTVGVVLFPEKHNIQIYDEKSMPDIIKTYNDFPESWKERNKVIFILSDNKELMKYPIKRGYKYGQKFFTYPIEKSLFDELHKTGKVIGEIK